MKPLIGLYGSIGDVYAPKIGCPGEFSRRHLRLISQDNSDSIFNIAVKRVTRSRFDEIGNIRLYWFEKFNWLPLNVELRNGERETVLVNIKSMKKRLNLLSREVDELKSKGVITSDFIRNKINKKNYLEVNPNLTSNIFFNNSMFKLNWYLIDDEQVKTDLIDMIISHENPDKRLVREYKKHKKEYQEQILSDSQIVIDRYVDKYPFFRDFPECLPGLTIICLLTALKILSPVELNLHNCFYQDMLSDLGVEIETDTLNQMEIEYLRAFDWNLNLTQGN